MGTPASGVVLAHAVPGRFRLRIDGVKGDARLAQGIAERLGGVAGVVHVDANPTTGSVVVRHARRHEDWLEDLATTLQSLAPVVPEADAERVVAQVRRHHRRGGHASGHVARFFRDVNAGVAETAGGIDLALLVPAALVLLGVGTFAGSERAVLPRWYELVWFGVVTFIMLNAAGVPRATAAEEAAELAAAL